MSTYKVTKEDGKYIVEKVDSSTTTAVVEEPVNQDASNDGDNQQQVNQEDSENKQPEGEGEKQDDSENKQPEGEGEKQDGEQKQDGQQEVKEEEKKKIP